MTNALLFLGIAALAYLGGRWWFARDDRGPPAPAVSRERAPRHDSSRPPGSAEARQPGPPPHEAAGSMKQALEALAEARQSAPPGLPPVPVTPLLEATLRDTDRGTRTRSALDSAVARLRFGRCLANKPRGWRLAVTFRVSLESTTSELRFTDARFVHPWHELELDEANCLEEVIRSAPDRVPATAGEFLPSFIGPADVTIILRTRP